MTSSWSWDPQRYFPSFGDFLLPGRLTLSREVDLVPPGADADQKATRLEASIGEFSLFHATHGFYVDGVSAATAKLPTGWATRVVPFAPSSANGVIGWCPAAPDLCAAKLIAGRVKDIEFVAEAARQALVMPAGIVERLAEVDVDQSVVDASIAKASRLPAPSGLLSVELDTSGRPDHGEFDPTRYVQAIVDGSD